MTTPIPRLPLLSARASLRSGGSKASATSHRSARGPDSPMHIPDEGHGGGAVSARQSTSTAARRDDLAGVSNQSGRRDDFTKAEFQKIQKSKEHALKHERMLAQRKKDDVIIKENADRSQKIRDQKFREMMDDIRSNDGIRVEAAHIIHQQEMEEQRKRQHMWGQWDREVSQRVELQLQKYMTRKDFTPRGAVLHREELLKTDDPMKRSLMDQKAEDNFRRLADNIIQGGRAMSEGKDSLHEMLRQRQVIEEAVDHRSMVRPTLPVEQWGQQELFAGPYGYFAQRCERVDRGEPFHSNKRMGADRHQPDETDGMETAGKTRERRRTYVKHNQMGMLVGDHCQVGQAYRHKQSHGGGSAAPLQDHYFYERGNDVVENEFPVGKRCYKHLNDC